MKRNEVTFELSHSMTSDHFDDWCPLLNHMIEVAYTRAENEDKTRDRETEFHKDKFVVFHQKVLNLDDHFPIPRYSRQ